MEQGYWQQLLRRHGGGIYLCPVQWRVAPITGHFPAVSALFFLFDLFLLVRIVLFDVFDGQWT